MGAMLDEMKSLPDYHTYGLVKKCLREYFLENR